MNVECDADVDACNYLDEIAYELDESQMNELIKLHMSYNSNSKLFCETKYTDDMDVCINSLADEYRWKDCVSIFKSNKSDDEIGRFLND